MNDKYQGLGLSENELAALEGEDDVIEPQAEDESDLDDDDGGDGVDDITTDPNVDTDADPESKPEPEAPAVTPEPSDEKPDFTPNVEPVADYEKVIGELTAKEDELAQKFDDGDITQREYRAEIRALDSQRRTIEDQQRDFERSQDLAVQKWQWEVDTFMEASKDAGVDYKKNPMLNAALDTAVKQLASDPVNADKTNKWFLTEAHKQVTSLFGKGAEAPKPLDPVKKALRDRQPGMEKVPQTLADVPAAEMDVSGDRFSKLDNLTGMALERALAALPPAEAQAYLER